MIYIFINLITSGLSIFVPYLTGTFLDNLIAKGDINIIYRFCFTRLGLFFFTFFFGYISNRIYTSIQIKMSFEFNRDILAHIHKLSLKYTEDLDYAYHSQLINSDVNSLIIFCITVIQSVLINLLTLMFTSVITFRLNSAIAKGMTMFIFLYIIFYYLFRKSLYLVSKEISESQSTYFSSLFEQLSLLKLVKINSIYKAITLRLEKSFKIVSESVLKGQKYNYAFTSLDTLITTLAHIYIYLLGGISILKGQFTIGMFTVFLNYFTMVLGAVRYFYNFGSQYQNKLVSYDRLEAILNKPKENNGNIVLDNINSIELKNVSFQYKEEQGILKDFQLKLGIGNIYCILGSNGSGKSTLLDLINGFYIDEKEGSIKFNSIDINNINMINARKKLISYSDQGATLIKDTIKYNILLEDRDFSEFEKQKLEYIADIIDFKDFVLKLPDGYDTVINDRGNNISGGEKQKISLLRSLLKYSNILLLDEPTTALDQKSTKQLKSYLSTIKENKIIVIVTHDKEIVDIADYVYELDELAYIN